VLGLREMLLAGVDEGRPHVQADRLDPLALRRWESLEVGRQARKYPDFCVHRRVDELMNHSFFTLELLFRSISIVFRGVRGAKPPTSDPQFKRPAS
jgi:hypothetical protein